jgi:hypothetical protein
MLVRRLEWWYSAARMANPNPSPSTRFGAGQANGSRGRQKAARDKLSAAFLEALNEAFYEPNDSGGCKGLDAIKKVRDEDPATFARIFAALMPKQVEIEDNRPEDSLTDEEVELLYQDQLAKLRGPEAEPAPIVVPGSRRVN